MLAAAIEVVETRRLAGDLLLPLHVVGVKLKEFLAELKG